MIDPKMLELSICEGIPSALPRGDRAGQGGRRPEMDRAGNGGSLSGHVPNGCSEYRRLQRQAERSPREGEALTRRAQTGFDEDGKPVFEERPLPMEPLPNVVVIVDEMADLMLVAGRISSAVSAPAQMAGLRAC